MTVMDKIKSMEKSELVDFLCKYMDCDEKRCPAVKECYYGHTGLYDWLESEVEDDEEL